MSDYRDDNSIQTEEELGRLEDSREREDERPRGRAADPRDLPRPLFRIKALHSNETFYAYFPQSPKGQVPSTLARLGRGLGGRRASRARRGSGRGRRRRALVSRSLFRRRGGRRRRRPGRAGPYRETRDGRRPHALRPGRLRDARRPEGARADRQGRDRAHRADRHRGRPAQGRGQPGAREEGLRDLQAEDRLAQPPHEARLGPLPPRGAEGALLFLGGVARGFPRARQGPRRGVQDPHRAAPDRRQGRGASHGRLRRLRPRPMLPRRDRQARAGVHQDGQGPESLPQLDEDLRPLRTAPLLPGL